MIEKIEDLSITIVEGFGNLQVVPNNVSVVLKQTVADAVIKNDANFKADIDSVSVEMKKALEKNAPSVAEQISYTLLESSFVKPWLMPSILFLTAVSHLIKVMENTSLIDIL